MMKRWVLPFCIAALLALTACQTANVGTSELESGEETSEPTGKEPVPPVEGAEAVEPNGLEQNVDRPGATYREFAMEQADASRCQAMCEKQMRCMAWTYKRPGPDGEAAICQFKHSVPDKVVDQDCCVSGVNPRAEQRMAQMRASGLELNVNRPGGDFRDFAMERPTPEKCQEACENLMDCKAFTYVRPGVDGEKAHCYLKSSVPEQVAEQDCCISGLK